MKYVHVDVGDVTLTAGGWAHIKSFYPSNWLIVVLESYTKITPIAAISVCGTYLIGAPNTAVTGLELGFICSDS